MKTETIPAGEPGGYERAKEGRAMNEPKTQWALGSVRDENDNLHSVWVEVPIEDRPYADDPFGDAFRRARIARRVTLGAVADALHVSAVYVSQVERGVKGIKQDEHAAWWFALAEAQKGGE